MPLAAGLAEVCMTQMPLMLLTVMRMVGRGGGVPGGGAMPASCRPGASHALLRLRAGPEYTCHSVQQQTARALLGNLSRGRMLPHHHHTQGTNTLPQHVTCAC